MVDNISPIITQQLGTIYRGIQMLIMVDCVKQFFGKIKMLIPCCV
jgi:hypothetical protein